MTVLEAWRASVPVIAHRVGGLKELLSDECGLLVESHSGVGYADALQQLLFNGAARQLMIGNGLARLKERYSSENNKNAYAQLYRTSLG